MKDGEFSQKRSFTESLGLFPSAPPPSRLHPSVTEEHKEYLLRKRDKVFLQAVSATMSQIHI